MAEKQSRISISPGFVPGNNLYSISPSSQINEKFYLGTIPLGKTNNLLPQQWQQGRVKISSPDNGALALFFDADSVVVVQNCEEDINWKDVFSAGMFVFGFYIESETVMCKIYINQLPLLKFNKKIANCLQTVFARLLHVRKDYDEHSLDSTLASSETDSVGLVQFFRNVTKMQNKNLAELEEIDVQHPLLKPTLRLYQKEAVRWMLMREVVQETKETLHPLFEEIKLESGILIYFNKYTGFVDNTKPLAPTLRTGGILADEMGLGKTVEVLACILLSPKPSNNSVDTSCSSDTPSVLISSKKRKRRSVVNTVYTTKNKRPELTDAESRPPNLRQHLKIWYEAKLDAFSVTKAKEDKNSVEVYCICGNTLKTKDIVLCIDCLKYQHGLCLGYRVEFGDYRCPNCWTKQPLLESKATLIVCPITLRDQWSEEICKHISGLRIFQYHGSKVTPVYPIELLDYDIVITTFSVLQSELQLSETIATLNLRHAKRYSAKGSPLSRVNWWRLCLDEAQMVETPTNLISQMAKKLTAEHRWAVTGTPITRDIKGLYGLIDYLQLEPYNEYDTWKYMLYLPYCCGNTDPMFSFLAEVMWRRSKEEVIDQIGIPPQSTIEYSFELNAIENYFYQKEHNLAHTLFHEKISNVGADLHIPVKSLDKQLFKNILQPLFSIRQICSDAGSIRSRYLVSSKQVNTLKDLLNAMITKNMNMCEENLRNLVACLNGLAGISLLSNEEQNAADNYRKVLQLSLRFKGDESTKGLSIDKLQLIHAMHNLAEILDKDILVDRTLRDTTLREECQSLKESYLNKYHLQALSSFEESEASTRAIQRLQGKFTLKNNEWFAELLEWIAINGLFDDLKLRIFTLLSNAAINESKLYSLCDERDLLYYITTWNDDVLKSRKECYCLLSKLYTFENSRINISNEMVQCAMDCHLRPVERIRKPCQVCSVSRQMCKYEVYLFEMHLNQTRNGGQKQSGEETLSTLPTEGSWKPTWQELAFRALVSLAKSKNAEQQLINDGETYLNLIDALKKEFKLKRKFWTDIHQHVNALDELNMCITRFSLAADYNKSDPVTNDILMKLSSTVDNRGNTIHQLDEANLNWNRSTLDEYRREATTDLENNLGTGRYLETLQSQQYAGQKPDPCPICQNELSEQWGIFPCGHSFCLDCMDGILRKGNIQTRAFCSVCRLVHRIMDISYVHSNCETESSDMSAVVGDYSTKIKGIIQLILKLRDDEADVKIVLFSTWVNVLRATCDALRVNNISTETLFQRQFKDNLKNFKDPSKNITVLLIPIQFGSMGLNITEATHVILMEPLLNVGDELQSVGRVHRIGQTRPTTVHKFYIKGTVEENIHKAMAENTLLWDTAKYTLGEALSLFEFAPAQLDSTQS